MVIAIVVLKFNHASVVTVGVLTGLMFLLFSAEQFALAALDRETRWLWAIFGVLTAAAGIVALVHPVSTFTGLADILGFVFLLLGVLWMIQAFMERAFNSVWWLTLISGVLMIGIAFWVSGQFFLTRAATLLVFVGIWAAMKGITDIVRAFQIRASVHDRVRGDDEPARRLPGPTRPTCAVPPCSGSPEMRDDHSPGEPSRSAHEQ